MADNGLAPAGMLTRLLRRAHETNELTDAMPMLTVASRFLPAFHTMTELGEPPRRALVSDGDRLPMVIYVPSFLAGSGPHQFVRLTMALAHRPETQALVLPGFDPGTPVPATWPAAMEALSAAVRAAAAGRPYVLIGHSIGGVLAHALAGRLESTRDPAAGVVLIDTLDPDPHRRSASFDWAMGWVLDRDQTGTVVNDENLVVMGAYLRLIEEWTPGPTGTPTLLLRADLRHGAAVGGWPVWDVADTVLPVAADHFSILEENVDVAAKLIESWLADR